MIKQHFLPAGLLIAALAVLILTANPHGEGNPLPAGLLKIVRLDPRFDLLVPKNTQLEKVAEGFSWVEGPVWNSQGRYLLFSDIPNNSIFKWREGSMGVSLFLKPSGYSDQRPFTGKEPGSNGLTYDATGRLVICMVTEGLLDWRQAGNEPHWRIATGANV